MPIKGRQANNTHTFDPERNSPRWETLELHCREIKS
jgi:hypothetical protein